MRIVTRWTTEKFHRQWSAKEVRNKVMQLHTWHETSQTTNIYNI
jgi:hypothetical protein